MVGVKIIRKNEYLGIIGNYKFPKTIKK